MVYRSTVGPDGQNLFIDGKTVLIPPNTFVIPNIIAASTWPEFWGPDHMAWRPDRWIATSPDTGDVLVDPPMGKDTYFPFAAGARGCIGKKFAIVEYVAIISTLLRDYQIEVVPHAGESVEQAQQHCAETVVEGNEQVLVVQMRNPESVTLRLVKRGEMAAE